MGQWTQNLSHFPSIVGNFNDRTDFLKLNSQHSMTSDRESTRLVNKELSDLWKIPTPEGHSISEPFRPEEFAAALRRPKSEKSPGLDSFP